MNALTSDADTFKRGRGVCGANVPVGGGAKVVEEGECIQEVIVAFLIMDQFQESGGTMIDIIYLKLPLVPGKNDARKSAVSGEVIPFCFLPEQPIGVYRRIVQVLEPVCRRRAG